MEGEIKIEISDIINNLNDDELFVLCEEYKLDVTPTKFPNILDLYRKRLKIKISKAFDKEINLKSFIENFVSKLSK